MKIVNEKLAYSFSPRNHYRLSSSIIALLALFLIATSNASEFRSFTRISAPTPIPAGATLVRPIVPLFPGIIEQEFAKVARNYMSSEFTNFFDENFTDKKRLPDLVTELFPQDTQLQVLAISGIQTLDQYYLTNDKGKITVVSKVAFLARTRLEFNHPTLGFQQFEGTNEFIMDIKQRDK